jgi:hypothetical protein
MSSGGLTLKQLQASPGWMWAYCGNKNCRHSRALAVAPFVIRWGPTAPGDMLRKCLVCEDCGHRGALLYRPSWTDIATGWQPFPYLETS